MLRAWMILLAILSGAASEAMATDDALAGDSAGASGAESSAAEIAEPGAEGTESTPAGQANAAAAPGQDDGNETDVPAGEADPNAAPPKPPVPLKTVAVGSRRELQQALRDAEPGMRIRCAPGRYGGGYLVRRFRGEPDRPLIIEAADPGRPPVFQGGNDGLKLRSCRCVKLKSLVFRGARGNGVHVDDGGSPRIWSQGIILEDLRIEDVGPRGNHDAIKISGVVDFVIRSCRIRGWGGSGVDMVGCHGGLVEGCVFEGRPGARQKNAIQIKGGSTSILVQGCTFLKAGERAVCVGGSTGADYFRPLGVPYEAKGVIVAGNRFVGGEAQLAWITSMRSHVHHNIFYQPKRWVLRILQETKSRRFEPCQDGIFAHNLIVAGPKLRRAVNVGPRTAPETFVFRGNAWMLAGPRRKPQLPVREVDGVHGVTAELKKPGSPEMRIESDDPRLKLVGPRAYTPWGCPADFAEIRPPKVPPAREAQKALGQGDLRKLLAFAGLGTAGLLVFSAGVVIHRARRR